MYRNTSKDIVLCNIKLKMSVIVQKSKKLRKIIKINNKDK